MADGAGVDVSKLLGLAEELKALPRVVSERLLKGATATACSVIRREAVLRAPEWTGPVSEGHPPPGTLKRAIYQARLSSKCEANIERWIVSVRRGRNAKSIKRGGKQVSLDAFYAMWVEYGHYARQPKAAGSRKKRQANQRAGNVRWVPAKPFMRPALETKRAEAAQAFADYLRNNLPTATSAMRFLKARQ